MEVSQAGVHSSAQHGRHEGVDGALQPGRKQLCPPLPEVGVRTEPLLCSQQARQGSFACFVSSVGGSLQPAGVPDGQCTA